jgi:arylsulfatase A-like enzyme
VHYEDHFDGDMLISPAAILRCSEIGKRLLWAVGQTFAVASPRKDAARINREFLDWVSERREDRPFFAFLNYMDAHDPYLTPVGFDRHFEIKPQDGADFATIVDWHRRDKRKAPSRDLTLIHDAYDDCLASLDEQLGRLFDALETRGLFRDTLIIVTSDHGEELGEHQLYGHSMSLYRPELDVPLLMLGPVGVPAKEVVHDAVSLRDLPATIVERLGMAGASPFPGRSLARYWSADADREGTSAEPVLSESDVEKDAMNPKSRVPAARGPMQALLLEPNVYIRSANGHEELYDLASDPNEAHNLAGRSESRSVIERFRSVLGQASSDQKARR